MTKAPCILCTVLFCFWNIEGETIKEFVFLLLLPTIQQILNLLFFLAFQCVQVVEVLWIDGEGEVVAEVVVSVIALCLVVVDAADDGAQKGVFVGGGLGAAVGIEDGADLRDQRADGALRARGGLQLR